MKVVLLDPASKLQLVEAPEPTVGDEEVLIRVGACGICASDLHLAQIRGGGPGPPGSDTRKQSLPYPLVPGHEVAGTVVQVGRAVAQIQGGEDVVVQPAITCDTCRMCRRGFANLCSNAQVIGLHRPGGFAEYVAVPARNTYITGELPHSAAACTEPLACALHGLVRLAPRPADKVLVFGTGTIGLFFLQLLRQQCAGPVTVTDRHRHRLETARRLGADRTVLADGEEYKLLEEEWPGGFDCVVDATGVPQVIEAAFRYPAAAGKLLLLGSPPTASTIAIHPRQVQRYDVTVVGSYSFQHEFDRALQLLRAGSVQTDIIVTHRYRRQDCQDAWEQAQSGRDSIKVQLVPD